MPTNEEIQKDLEGIFRQQELERRAGRTRIMKNHIELTNDMTKEEKEHFRKELVPDTRGYWKKLWDAIRGR